MSLCLLTAGTTVVLAATTFSLSWIHSVEHTHWEETWRVDPAGLQVVEARIKGSGAGMEPPDGSVLKDGWWVYSPKVPALERLILGSSGATSAGWKLCSAGVCRTVGAEASEATVVEFCD